MPCQEINEGTDYFCFCELQWTGKNCSIPNKGSSIGGGIGGGIDPGNIDSGGGQSETSKIDKGKMEYLSGMNFPWDSKQAQYKQAAVASDHPICSEIGRMVLQEWGGSAVDAAIAAMFCLGVLHPQASGIGGGSILTIYETPHNVNSSDKEAMVINGQEVAPLDATMNMFQNGHVSNGGLSIAVPGSVKAFYEAWKQYGRVKPWSRLLEPAITLAREGYNVSRILAIALEESQQAIMNNGNFKAVFMKNGKLLQEGEIAYRPTLANTLQTIAESPEAFYSKQHELMYQVVADVTDNGGIIQVADLEEYETQSKPPLELNDGFSKVLTPGPPSSGALLILILNVIREFNISSANFSTLGNKVDTYHNIIETFKLVFSHRNQLGDEEFENIKNVLTQLQSLTYAKDMKKKVNSETVHNISHYGSQYHPSYGISVGRLDTGGTHVSILSTDGSAVSISSTINSQFGSKVGL